MTPLSPGGPGKPVSHGGPGKPGQPGAPLSPSGPLKPFAPGNPGVPGCPRNKTHCKMFYFHYSPSLRIPNCNFEIYMLSYGNILLRFCIVCENMLFCNLELAVVESFFL